MPGKSLKKSTCVLNPMQVGARSRMSLFFQYQHQMLRVFPGAACVFRTPVALKACGWHQGLWPKLFQHWLWCPLLSQRTRANGGKTTQNGCMNALLCSRSNTAQLPGPRLQKRLWKSCGAASYGVNCGDCTEAPVAEIDSTKRPCVEM